MRALNRDEMLLARWDRVSSRPPSNAVPPGVPWQAFCGLLLVSFSPWRDISSFASCQHTPVILIGLVPAGLRDVIRWPEGPKSWLALPTAPHFLTPV